MLQLLSRSSIAKIRPSTIGRLALNHANGFRHIFLGSTATKYSFRMKVVPASAISENTYMDKNEKLKRQQSPHLSIYRPELTSMLSIWLRGTGMFLAAVIWGLGIAVLVTDKNVDYFIDEANKLELPDWFWCFGRLAIAYPYSYHLCNGIRHLVFMTASCLGVKEIYATGYLMLLLSTLLTISLVFIEDIEKMIKEEKESTEE